MITLPKDDIKKQDILKKIALALEEGKEYSEDDINAIIKSFDVDDYVLVRRELVNFNYLGKDSYKAKYWLKQKELSTKQLQAILKNQERMSGLY